MFYIHILTSTERIKNKWNQTFKVLSPKIEQLYISEGVTVREHKFKLQTGRIDIEVVCPEIVDEEKTDEAYIIIPEFIIPRRPYPIYIYLYAIAIYCLNPKMGQREASKRTRERFGLKTFSHTTLGRALRKLESLIKQHEGITNDNEEAAEKSSEMAGNFPIVERMKNRKEKVALYLKKASADDASLKQEASQQCKRPNYSVLPYVGAFIDACHNIVNYTFLKYHCLLL